MLLLNTFACAPSASEAQLGGQTGEEMPPPCTAVREPLALDDARLGFAAEDVLAALARTVATLTWAGGEPTSLTMTVALEGEEAALLDQAPDGKDCPDLLVVPVAFGFRTGDGLLDDVWAIDLLASGGESAEASARLDPTAWTGTWETEADPYLTARWSDGLASGDLRDVAATDPAAAVLATW
ncbi:MAG: hypothetical protein ACOZNI_24775 [Myxococcota bacterium]